MSIDEVKYKQFQKTRGLTESVWWKRPLNLSCLVWMSSCCCGVICKYAMQDYLSKRKLEKREGVTNFSKEQKMIYKLLRTYKIYSIFLNVNKMVKSPLCNNINNKVGFG